MTSSVWVVRDLTQLLSSKSLYYLDLNELISNGAKTEIDVEIEIMTRLTENTLLSFGRNFYFDVNVSPAINHLTFNLW